MCWWTARNNPDFMAYCDEVILVPALDNLEYGDAISPQFPILVMMDLLYAYCLEQDQEKIDAFLEDTARALVKP